MNILIDASQFPHEKTGVGVYAVHLIHAILETDHQNQYTILIQDDERAFEDVAQANARFVKYPARVFRKFFFRFLLEQLVIPFLVLKLKIDVVHSLHYSFPLLAFGSRRVVTIHDMTFFNCPDVHERIKVVYFRLFILLAARVADRLIADSESTRRDIIARTGADPTTIMTIHLGVPALPNEACAALENSTIRQQLGLPADFILFIGTVEPRKNLLRLILAFAGLLKEISDCQLVIVGKKGWGDRPVYRLIHELDIADRIVFTGYLDEVDKRHLLRHAAVFVYPSLYEGFGLPLLEALSVGLPSVASNVSSLPEVAGSGAILVDPHDIDAIRHAIRQILTEEDLRNDLAHKAREQAGRFSWQTAALATTSVYESA